MSANILNEETTGRHATVVFNLLLASLMIIALIFVADPLAHFSARPVVRETPETPETPRPLLAEATRPASGPAAGSLPAAPAAKAESLTPRMHAVLDHVARRYRVSPAALLPIFQAAQLTGRKRSVDALLIVAIIGIESSFNPLSESAMGALGLMQVMPRYHQDKLPAGAGNSFFLDPVINIQIGTHILDESIRRHGDLIAGLQQFGGALNDEQQTYANKVLAEKERLEQAANRSGGSVTAPQAPDVDEKARPPLVNASAWLPWRLRGSRFFLAEPRDIRLT